jgi:FixJ family two-component response regulator
VLATSSKVRFRAVRPGAYGRRTLSKRPIRIAVVDDEASIRKALVRLLHGAGIEAEAFGSGAQYLAQFQEHRPDCLVLDAHLPGLSGFEVQDRMRAAGVRIPVVMITGNDTPGAEGHALANGAYTYLRKPVDGAVLIAAIENAIAAFRR